VKARGKARKARGKARVKARVKAAVPGEDGTLWELFLEVELNASPHVLGPASARGGQLFQRRHLQRKGAPR
jgi:hypothetical protein